MYKYIDRGFKDTIVMIPGWATDHRIFGSLKVRSNYILPVDFSPNNFKEKLIRALKRNNVTRVSLLGLSLGGFVASDFACEYPDLTDKIIMVSIRKRYVPRNLDVIKSQVIKNKSAFLYKFYRQCFYKKEQMSYFKNIFRDYCRETDLSSLLEGLDYLSACRIDTEKLKTMQCIKIVHGEYDEIAPIGEASGIQKKLDRSEFITVKDAGHIPLFSEDFLKCLS